MNKRILPVVLGLAFAVQAGCCQVDCMLQSVSWPFNPGCASGCYDTCEHDSPMYVSNEVGTDVSDLLPPPPPPFEDDTPSY
jgi:hypothetical protein